MATIINKEAIILQSIEGFLPASNAFDILRLDLCHPIVSGNKWFKLNGLQEAMKAAQKKSIISFGGAWSNHLVALAYYAHHYQIPCKAILRGHYEVLSPSLLFAQEHGMELHFVDAIHYSALKKDASSLQSKYPDAYILPEGGNSEMGVNGASAIASFLTKSYDYVCVSVGSGTTFAGLRRALSIDTHLMGFAPMKGGSYLKDEIEAFIPAIDKTSYTILDAYHFGGFGKITPELISFMNDCYQRYELPLDRVYTAKMMWGISELIQTQQLPSNARIVAIHTGGLQGNQSIAQELIF
jgi:1-aminocyclopropane-1-carboxylate deaminase/D-cysteine desulfhydrase-like pyridoxal-dependent ACC family enzyme